jgi:exosome complex RNA-binding protein Rrp42 (RNase PH superfamily)
MSISPFKPPITPTLVKESYLNMLKRGLRPDNRDLKTPMLI